MTKIHALTLTCQTPKEYESKKSKNESPGCVNSKNKANNWSRS